MELEKGVAFENKFLDLDGSLKALLHSKDLQVGGDFMIDIFVTGTQRSSNVTQNPCFESP
jgi:hypothetical protein